MACPGAASQRFTVCVRVIREWVGVTFAEEANLTLEWHLLCTLRI